MNILEIFKAPFNGRLVNNKLEIKQSLIINLILSCIISLVFIICSKTLVNDLYRSFGMGSIFSYIGMDDIISQLVLRMFILFTFNFLAIPMVFSGIIFLIGKFIFKNNLNYKEYLSVCTYSNILPVSIMLIGCLFSLFSIILSVITFMVQVIVLIILTYEGFSEIICGKKSKLMYTISLTYIINSVLFSGINYFIIMSVLETRMNNLFY